jgi:hypothetical protein
MPRYRLFYEDGADAGEARYSVYVEAGEEIVTGDGRRLRVLELVDVSEEDSPYAGLLTVAPEGGVRPLE